MEDLVRALQFDAGAIRGVVGTSSESDVMWLMQLAQDVQSQNLISSGHVDHAQETLTEMALLHDLLLGPMEDRQYIELYERAQPHLDDMLKKSGDQPLMEHPVALMMVGLYGWLVLRMKKETLSAETEASMVALREMANGLARGHIRVYQGR
jgi:hypothetical protein